MYTYVKLFLINSFVADLMISQMTIFKFLYAQCAKFLNSIFLNVVLANIMYIIYNDNSVQFLLHIHA